MRNAFVAALLALVLAATALAQDLALTGATIYVNPTAGAIPRGVVLIRDGRIVAAGRRGAVAIPRGAQVIDCSGLTITAGFWNSHVHFTQRKWARAESLPAAELEAQVEAMLTSHGFTSVFDTGSMLANTQRIRDRIESGEVRGPRIRTTGEVLFPKGGAPEPLILDVIGTMRVRTPEIATAEEALAETRKLLDGGADAIKLYAATWAPPIVALPEPAIRAAAEEAHRRGRLVFAHPSNREGLLAAVRGGVDVIVHTAPQAGPWDETILTAMKEARVAVIPTLELWRHELRHDRISSRERFAEMGVEQLRAWRAAGGLVLFGTDTGYMDDYDPTEEYALMARAGMTFRDILAALTTAPAERFGDASRLGRIAPGLVADLVILDGDPARDVRAFGAVQGVIRDGKVVYRVRSLRAR